MIRHDRLHVFVLPDDGLPLVGRMQSILTLCCFSLDRVKTDWQLRIARSISRNDRWYYHLYNDEEGKHHERDQDKQSQRDEHGDDTDENERDQRDDHECSQQRQPPGGGSA